MSQINATTSFTLNSTPTTLTRSNISYSSVSSLWTTATTSVNTTIWASVLRTKVRDGKYRVRCRGCSRWAKILREEGSGLTVECQRCFGESAGYIS